MFAEILTMIMVTYKSDKISLNLEDFRIFPMWEKYANSQKHRGVILEFYKNVILIIYAKYTEKHRSPSLFFDKNEG